MRWGWSRVIAVVGGYGVGMTMRLRRAPEAGETVTGGALSIGDGGKGSNQAIGIARLGQQVSLFTAVGADSAAQDALALWQSEDVDSSAVVRTQSATMTGFILVEDGGENRIAIAPGALDELTPEHVEAFRGAIGKADLLVVSLEVPWPVAQRALDIAGQHGITRLLNPAPAPQNLELGSAEIITPNYTEARRMLALEPHELRTEEQLALQLASRTGSTVVMTLGSRGALVVEAGVLTHIEPSPAREVVDTTGAGDAFTAAFAVALVEGRDVVEAARWAAQAGAHAVSIAEVVPSLPYRSDLAKTTNRLDQEHA